jgi:hypothetical protein
VTPAVAISGKATIEIDFLLMQDITFYANKECCSVGYFKITIVRGTKSLELDQTFPLYSKKF